MAKRAVPSNDASVKRWTLEKQAEFLAHLAASCNVKASARAVGMSEAGVHRLRLRSPEFRAAWEQAIEEAYVRLEAILLERAINGVEKALVKDGARTGSVIEFSERLGLSLIHAARPATRRGARPADVERDRAEIRRQIDAKLSEMNKKLGGDG